MRVGDVLNRVKGAKRKPSGGWMAPCPAHRDDTPSLSIDEGTDGRVLLKCFAGCDTSRVCEAIGITLADLAPEPLTAVAANGRGSVKAVAKQIDYSIRDAAGVEVAVHRRIETGDGKKRFQWFLPGADHPGLGGLPTADVPLYGTERLSGVPLDDDVVLCEGEKAADALLTAGIAAVGTTTGANGCPSARVVVPLAGRRVVLWPDADDQGRRHMEAVGKRLQGTPNARLAWLTWPDAPEGGDAADWLAQKPDAENMRTVLASAPAWPVNGALSGIRLFRPYTARELLAREHPPMRWVIPGLLPEGGALLAGKGKLGKSFLCLALTIAVAAGGRALGKVKVEPGEVLYVALEDGEHRVQRRMRMMLGSEGLPAHWAGWHGANECPTLDQGGIEALDEWLADHAGVRLVIIDTLQRIRPEVNARDSLYATDYNALAPLTRLGQRRRCCVMAVHHTRKAEAEDIVDELSGSTGLSAATETILIFKRQRGAKDARLYITGRDLDEDRDLALAWDGLSSQWVLTGDTAEVTAERERADSALHQRWLYDFLVASGHRRQSADVLAAGKLAGLSRDACYAAKDGLGVKARKGDGAWFWELPHGAQPPDIEEASRARTWPEVQEVGKLPGMTGDFQPEVAPEVAGSSGSWNERAATSGNFRPTSGGSEGQNTPGNSQLTELPELTATRARGSAGARAGESDRDIEEREREEREGVEDMPL